MDGRFGFIAVLGRLMQYPRTWRLPLHAGHTEMVAYICQLIFPHSFHIANKTGTIRSSGCVLLGEGVDDQHKLTLQAGIEASGRPCLWSL